MVGFVVAVARCILLARFGSLEEEGGASPAPMPAPG
jgi:hypothetical protein